MADKTHPGCRSEGQGDAAHACRLVWDAAASPCARLIPRASLARRCHPRYGPGTVRPSQQPLLHAQPFLFSPGVKSWLRHSSWKNGYSGGFLHDILLPQKRRPVLFTEELQNLPSLQLVRGGAALGHSLVGRELPSRLKLAALGLALPCLRPRSEIAAALHRSTPTSHGVPSQTFPPCLSVQCTALSDPWDSGHSPPRKFPNRAGQAGESGFQIAGSHKQILVSAQP